MRNKTSLLLACIILMVFSIMPNFVYAANEELMLDSSRRPEELVKVFLGDDMEINNVSYTGHEKARGAFSGGSKIIGFEEGIILSTGSVNNIAGPNKDHGISSDFKLPGDEDLSKLIDGVETRDASVLEFDFIPKMDCISFSYVFASEEYNEYVNQYNDCFAFFINGENMALIPESDTMVSINTINGGKPFGENPVNSQYFRNNEKDKHGNGALINIEMDGLTRELRVEAKVNPNEVNHIKLAIADARDCSLDSVVMLKAGSFVCPEETPSLEDLPQGTIIGRMPGYIKLSEPEKLLDQGNLIQLEYNIDLIRKHPNHSPRIYYWNKYKENWVALTTYNENEGLAKAVNKGEYAGWFVVLGVIQPEFTDEKDSREKDKINRMNGLGMIEGYYQGGHFLSRAIVSEENISRGEFTLLIYRILNIDWDDPKLPSISQKEAKGLLDDSFADSNEMPSWLLEEAGTLAMEKLLPWEDGDFMPLKPISKSEAVFMMNKALNYIEKEEAINQDVIETSSLITRGEALILIYNIFVKGLGW